MLPWEIIEIPTIEIDKFFTLKGDFSQIAKGIFPSPPEFWININDRPKKENRGEHYHVNHSKTELVVFLGNCLVSLHSKSKCENILFEKPRIVSGHKTQNFKGLLIFPETWHAFRLSPGVITLHFSSCIAKKEYNKKEKPCDH